MKVVFLGATRGIGRAMARQMAERGDSLVLLGRDLEELRRSAADLEVRGPAKAVVTVVSCDLEQPETLGPALARAAELLAGFDTVVCTAGIFATQEKLETDPAASGRLLRVNLAHSVQFAEEARLRLLAAGGGTLCMFASVAGDRGRKPVVIYGASKAGLAAYLEGLDHRYHAQGLRVVCIKPGFVHTSMTAGLVAPPFAGQPEKVAADALRAIDRGRPVLYTPWPWRWVMAVIRRLPRVVMRRVGF